MQDELPFWEFSFFVVYGAASHNLPKTRNEISQKGISFLGAQMNKEDGIVVLSCFDGMSCGQIALERAGIKVRKYYASEIDKYAIKITQKNYPDTIQLGDIQNWQEWDIETPDLIIAGSPCQGFSNAGHGLNFDDPRSKLFFTFKDILFYWVDKNPKLKWMLENVKMKKVWQDVISDLMGVEPVLINSALLSAQNRQRLYWANWDIPQPEDKGIFLKDIVESGEVDREKSYTIDANYFKGGNPKSCFEDGRRQLVFAHQSHKRAMVKENNGCIQVGNIYPSGGIAGRIYSPEGKSPALRTATGGNHMPKIVVKSLKHGWMPEKIVSSDKYPPLAAQSPDTKYKVSTDDGYTYRKLTPLECERLQTVPEGYTEGVSNTQRYRMLGNGWTVDVIAHIFKNMS
jgi:DNA-cytosine methyltransferase